MFKYKDSSATQLSMFDSLIGFTDREMRFLEKSWAKPFADYVFPAIDQKPFEVLYSDAPSRANTPVNVILGTLILQQLTGQSDDEILNSLLVLCQEKVQVKHELFTSIFGLMPDLFPCVLILSNIFFHTH